MKDPILILDADGVAVWSSPAARRYGLEPDDPAGRTLFDRAHPDEAGRLRKALSYAFEAPGRTVTLGALRMISADGHTLYFDSSLTYLPDTEGIDGLLAVLHDVTDRHQAEEAIERSEQKYRSLVESAHDLIFTSDLAGQYLYCNRAAAAALGTTPENVIGKYVDDFFPAGIARQYRAAIERVGRTGEDHIGEQKVQTQGRTVYLNIRVQPVRDRQDRIVAAQLIARDITSFKQALIALRESDERLRQVVRVSNIGIFDHDHRSGELYWSPELRRIYGIEPDERVVFSDADGDGFQIWSLVHPEDRERVAAELRQAFEAQHGLFDVEYRIVRRDGAIRWLSTRSQTFFEGEGPARRAVRTIGAVKDITERRLAERQLLLTQAAIEKSNTAIFWVSPAGEITYANDHACRSLRMTWEQLQGRRIWEIDPAVSSERWQTVWQELKRQKVLTLQTQHRRSDGTIFPVEVTGNYMTFEGEEHVFVFGHDITERQRAERELQLMHAAIDSSRTPFYSIDRDGRIIYANEAAGRSLDMTRAELIGRFVWDLDPDVTPEANRDYFEQIRNRGMLRFEARHRRKDGSMVPVEVTANFFSFKDEEYSLAFAQDITDRLRAERALRHSEDRLRQVTLVYNIGVFEYDHATGMTYWSPELRRYWGVTDDEPLPLSFIIEGIHPEDRERIQAAALRAHDPAGDGRYNEQHRIVRCDGSVRWVNSRSQTFFEGEGADRRAVRTVGATVDITDRVEAERALRQSLHEKEVLLREVHHRVKNNLQIIASVLHFQAKKIRDPADLAAFAEGRDRLRSMILVHEKLYQSHDLTRVDAGSYLRSLARELHRSHGRGGRVELCVTAGDIALPIESALPCGMIVCELLTNVFKYAFPGGRAGEAAVQLSADLGRVELTVSDNGVGLPAGFDPERSTSFGWQLVHNLTEQLAGTLRIEREPGTRVTISFPQEPVAP